MSVNKLLLFKNYVREILKLEKNKKFHILVVQNFCLQTWDGKFVCLLS